MNRLLKVGWRIKYKDGRYDGRESFLVPELEIVGIIKADFANDKWFRSHQLTERLRFRYYGCDYRYQTHKILRKLHEWGYLDCEIEDNTQDVTKVKRWYRAK